MSVPLETPIAASMKWIIAALSNPQFYKNESRRLSRANWFNRRGKNYKALGVETSEKIR